MRRIVMFNRVTADGYFAAPDGNLGWVVPDAELDAQGAAGTSGADTILFGRRTYEMFESFWPHVGDDASVAPDPHAPGRPSPEMRAMASWINAATKVVFSRSRTEVTWRNSRLISEFDADEIAAMKRRPGKDIMIFGSGSIVSQLTEHDLIDEYQLILSPVFLGSGRSLIDHMSKSSRLELIEATAYASGNVKLRYTGARTRG
jgi:dihydrofolate reductase